MNKSRIGVTFELENGTFGKVLKLYIDDQIRETWAPWNEPIPRWPQEVIARLEEEAHE